MGVMNSVYAATWYVKATANSGGNGSEDKPFNSLANAEAASGAGDTIYIMHSHSGVALDGQIVLKPDQKLIGTGPDVRRVPENAAGARITYSGGGGEGYPDGAIIQLSSDNEIANIHFKDMSFGGIVGIDVDFSGANIHDNLFTGGNIDNGWIRISVLLESSSGNSNVVVRDNVFRDGNFLGGIRAFHRGDSSGTYDFEGNHFDNMGFRPYFFWTFDTASLQADILDSSANNIGALGEFSEFANSDSILMQLSGSSDMDVLVDGYTYDNTGQFGGISNTGLELFIFGSGFGAPELGANNAHVTLKINNSSFSNAVTEAIQVLNLGIDSLMEIEITNTVVTDANPRQLGAFFGVGGAAISVIPEFFGNSGSLTSLMIENCDVIGSSAYAVGIYDFGTSGFSSVVDMGGGALGSIGHNRILDNVVGEIELFQTDGIGESNWWGEDPPRIDIYGGGSFEVDPVLLADPRP
ncbi:hypothetical protein ACFL1V_05840 [Pseudomonadota bacterium]